MSRKFDVVIKIGSLRVKYFNLRIWLDLTENHLLIDHFVVIRTNIILLRKIKSCFKFLCFSNRIHNDATKMLDFPKHTICLYTPVFTFEFKRSLRKFLTLFKTQQTMEVNQILRKKMRALQHSEKMRVLFWNFVNLIKKVTSKDLCK